MFASPLRCCGPIKNINGVLSIGTNNIESLGRAVCSIGRVRFASDKGGKQSDCCKGSPQQTVGRRVESWPKPEGSRDPPSNDPYRIKVPEVVVPPMPPSNAKWTLLTSPEQRDPPLQQPMGQGQHGPGQYSQGQFSQGQMGQAPEAHEDETRDEGFMAKLRGFIDKAAIDCTKMKGPCAPMKVPPPPPCPPPPREPFNWTYVAVTTAFLALMGVMYKLYLLKQEWDTVSDSKPVWRPRRKVKRPFHDQDLPACVQYLIVGTGTAGWAAYRAIAENDKKAKVFFVTKEDILPYSRPPMSKQMWHTREPPDVMKLNYLDEGKRETMFYADCTKFLDAVSFYRKKVGPALSIATGWCVLRVDAEEHVIYVKTMCGEQPIYYERCLLAPGAKAKNLNIFKSAPKPVREKATTLRTVRDLEIAFRKVRESKHVVILGGGLLGTELAWNLAKMNEVIERKEDEAPIQFVHVYKDPGILAGILPSYLGEWGAEKIRCENVQLMPNTQVYDAFLTKDKRLELTLSNGSSLVTDYVIVAVGTEPRTEMAEPSFLETDPVNGGFLVNTELEARTHLYVAGDAASIYSQWHNSRMRMEHYMNAEEQGFIAGANMTGNWVASNMEPHFFLRLGKVLEMEVVGEVGACMPTIALFKPCEEQEAKAREEKKQPTAPPPPSPPPAIAAKTVAAAGGDQKCYQQSEDYKERYKRGMLFYLRDETVVGIVFWNVPPIEDRKEVVTEMLRARPTYKDINLLAELLGFKETECDYIPPEDRVDIGPCIRNWRVF